MKIYVPRRFDRSAIFELLAHLKDRYPHGLENLDRLLDDVEAGRATLWQVYDGGRLAALAIEKPKEPRAVKLSTFVVAPTHRNHLIGQKLIRQIQQHWRQSGIEHARGTVADFDTQTLNFALNNGFSEIPDVRVNYGPERQDRVVVWTPETRSPP
ncbi:MAG: GNAT family N-acetyltransferase [Rhodomicrobium sp.]